MADNFGPGVSRVLDPKARNFTTVLWQQGRPPLDSELSLSQQLATEQVRLLSLKGTPSGWYGDALNPQDSFITSPSYSNWFKFGPQFSGEVSSIMWAAVNGWVIPVTSTLTGSPPGSPNNSDTWNRITLPPPPANTGDSRIDFVFLEAWQARVAPSPSATNKPASSAIYRYGNVEGGTSFLSDDLQDPQIGFETTQRIQIQYRIRVVSGVVGLASYPDGFDPSTVKGQGAGATPTSFVFTNMRKELGDAGLWRAGDGTQNGLGTVDGYTYAIPIAAVFRRNRVAWGSGNLNGSFDRNPTAVDRTGYKTFSTTPTLSADISASVTALALTSVANIPLPLTPATPVIIQIGDEYLTYTAITGSTMSGLVRGAYGSRAEIHKAGSTIRLITGRPDQMFSDQVAKTDILDLRHLVNPGGFDYQALLESNLDQLLRGKLKSTWKRSGGGPQGPFVHYQDIVSASPGPLGVTKLDAPDGIRKVWADPSAIQPVVIPISAPLATGTTNIGGTLGNSFASVTATHPFGTGFQPNDIITVPKSLFTGSLPGSDADQVRLVADYTYVSIRFMGETTDLSTGHYTLSNDGSGNLVITLTGAFAARNYGAFITLHVQYGGGRGLSRRPEAVHSVAYTSASPNIAIAPQSVPIDSQPLRASWLALWSAFQDKQFSGSLPSTAEAYVDPGSKSVALTPFRLMSFTQINGNSVFRTIQKTGSADATNGAMPANTVGGLPKWGSTDPLSLFSGYNDPTLTRANMEVIIPRKLFPGFGEVRAPILFEDNGNIDQGVNFGIYAPKGSVGNGVSTYIPMSNGSTSYCIFSTMNLVTDTPASYNAAFTFGSPIAGMRFFTDTRGLGRKGLELPPFYIFARLFAVYEAADYKANGSAFNPTTREPDPTPGSAVNLLRQTFDGPTFWIESDADGDPTCILNAEALDLTRSPNAISAFGSGDYVIEASIFGADRGCFDLNQDARIVLTRGRSEGLTANTVVTNPQFILPGAPELGDELAINYSRSPYQGDCWNSQNLSTDTGYKPGALSTSVRYQLMTTQLNYEALARPNQKPLEILAATGFLTTLGTGRFSGEVPTFGVDTRSVGFEPWTIPASSIAPRPALNSSALEPAERVLTVGTELLGATCHLPLGALFLDKDFRGNAIGGPTGDLRQMSVGDYSPATQAGSVAPNNQEYYTAPVHCASIATDSGVVVHVDGNGDSYNVLTTYRTNRGGSAFTASGLAGGDVGGMLPDSKSSQTSGGILSGIAYLVRNVPTSIGANEVSAGSEVLLLIVTTARAQSSAGTSNSVQINTSGSGEGYSAADLYRCMGHPLTNDPARTTVDPSNIVLARKSTLL